MQPTPINANKYLVEVCSVRLINRIRVKQFTSHRPRPLSILYSE